MAKNYYGGSKHTGLKVFAWIVTILLIAAIVAGVWYVARTTDNFTTNPFADESEEDDGSGFIPTPDDDGDEASADSPFSISMYKIDPEDYEDYGIDTYSVSSAYTLKVSVDSSCDIYEFEWSSDDTSGKVSISASSDGLSCTVTCSGAFSSQVTVTATETLSGLSASCKFDYVKRLDIANSNISVGYGSNTFLTTTCGSMYSSSDVLSSHLAVCTLPVLEDSTTSQNNYENSTISLIPAYGTGSCTEEYQIESYWVEWYKTSTTFAGCTYGSFVYYGNTQVMSSIACCCCSIYSALPMMSATQVTWSNTLSYFTSIQKAASSTSRVASGGSYCIVLDCIAHGKTTGTSFELCYGIQTDASLISTTASSVTMDGSQFYF